MRVTQALGLGVLLAGCGTAAGRIENGVFHSNKGYQIGLPGNGWRVEANGRADLELKRESPPGGMLANATCDGKPLGYSLPMLTRHLTFGLKNRVVVGQENEVRNGQSAERTVLRGTMDGMEVGVEAVVLKTERCVHDFLYVAPMAAFESGRADFRTFVESFAGAAR
jgi:hypothetical protein